MNNLLATKVYKYNFENLFNKKGYAYFTKGSYNLNIIGVRAKVDGNKVTNLFDDVIIVIYKTDTGIWQRKIYAVTTKPGLFYMRCPLSSKGTAIMMPNQYRGAWKLGKHNGKYEALVQVKPIKVYRDSNKDDIYDIEPNTTETGVFGINIHRSGAYSLSKVVDNFSAGCQVFADPTDFKGFMRLCNLQANKYGNSFTYTLLNEEDLK